MFLVLENNYVELGSSTPQGLKSQAAFFLKEKIRTIRLVLTDVTRAQLLTKVATDKSTRMPDIRTMYSISRAAFEIEDYWRIVKILHKRLSKFNKKRWRKSYKALIFLEHLLIHGPKSVALEFASDRDAIQNLGTFHFNDKKGFDCGLALRKQSERILLLLDNELVLKEERNHARKLVFGLERLGSFCQQATDTQGSDDFQRTPTNVDGSRSLSQQSSASLENVLQNEEFFDYSRKRNAHVNNYNIQQNSSVVPMKDEIQTHKKNRSTQNTQQNNVFNQSSWNVLKANTISKNHLQTELHEWDYEQELRPLLGPVES